MMVTLIPFIMAVNNLGIYLKTSSRRKNNDIFIIPSYTVGRLRIQIILEIKQPSEIRCSPDMLDFDAMIRRSAAR